MPASSAGALQRLPGKLWPPLVLSFPANHSYSFTEKNYWVFGYLFYVYEIESPVKFFIKRTQIVLCPLLIAKVMSVLTWCAGQSLGTIIPPYFYFLYFMSPENEKRKEDKSIVQKI